MHFCTKCKIWGLVTYLWEKGLMFITITDQTALTKDLCLTLLHSNVHAWFPTPSKREGAGNQA